MISLRKFFSGNRKSHDKAPEKFVQEFSTEPYNFQTITVPELQKQPHALDDLYTNQADGFLVKNFLSTDEVDRLMSNFDKVLNDEPANTGVGFTYPTIFAEFSGRLKQVEPFKREAATINYFEKNTAFNENFKTQFGVDVKGRLEQLLGSISAGKDILVAEGYHGRGHYPFATFRLLIPEKGLMSVHCGNYFGKTFEEFYEDLTRKVAVENQMSFFIMLQEPDSGGELTLFNFRWKQGQTKKNPTEDNEIIQPDGSKIYVEDNKEIIKDKIIPKKGDLILFQGGNIWHRVEKVRGKTPRITFGGFMGISTDKSKYYYWS